MSANKTPVILDTDICSDIDDIWALGMLLRSPEVDVKLVTSATCQPQIRAQVIAKMCDVCGRTDVPVGVGLDWDNQNITHAEWVQDYPIAKYPGTVYPDGVEAIIRTIMDSPQPVTLLNIAPLPNIAAALRREPAIAARTNFVGMHGSVFLGYNGSPEVSAEWNVKADVQAAKTVFTAPWRSITITPLDTCGLVRLKDARYQKVRASTSPVARAIIENYDIWRHGKSDDNASSVLFDTVAVYLTFTRELLNMKRMGIRITDDGFTVPDDKAQPMDVAVSWKDMAAFEDLLIERLTRE